MDAQTCILTRRSVRVFQQEPVARELIEKAVTLASYAPSWKNTQISRYIAIEDAEKRSYIGRTFCGAGHHNQNIIDGCAVLIAQTFVKSRSGFERDGTYSTDRGEGWQYYDCGIAAQTFCLAAHDLGLATVVMGMFDRKGLEKYLEVPEDQELMALIAVGKPAEVGSAPKRKGTDILLSWK